MRNLILLVLIVLCVSLPVAAQSDPGALGWVPADFDLLVRLDMSSLGQALATVNQANTVARFFQPPRANQEPTPLNFNAIFPLNSLDTEGASFATNVLPWLGDEVVIAYRGFDANGQLSQQDVLAVFPTTNAFQAAGALQAAISGQDFGAQQTINGVPVYVGDQISIALTPAAILLGSQDTLASAIAAGVGSGVALVDTAAYQQVMAAAGEPQTVFGYFDGDAALNLLNLALRGNANTRQLFGAFGAVLQAYDLNTLETAFLSGQIEGVAVNLSVNSLSGVVTASATIQTSATSAAPENTAFNADVLALIPRSAMLVQSGPDAQVAFYDALAAAPLSNYATDLLMRFLTVAPVAASESQPAIPSAAELQVAIDSFNTALTGLREFDLDADLVDHLGGSYAIALLPRPNNPSPDTGVAYDVLVVAQTADDSAALQGAQTLAQTLFALGGDAFEALPIGNATFQTVFTSAVSEPALQIGTVDGLLVVGTGTAVEQALRAHSGDNRLVNMPRWEQLHNDQEPSLYLDLNAIYNTFLPVPGGPVSRGIGQLGATSRDLGGGLYQVTLMMTRV